MIFWIPGEVQQKGMSGEALGLMLATWAAVILLNVFCFSKILRSPRRGT